MKVLCPICSDILLRHLCRSEVSWFCLRCHQEMPNFNVLTHCSVSEKVITATNVHHRLHKNTFQTPVRNHENLISEKSNIINSYINQDQKRLEVVGFILNKINIILVNTFAEGEKNIRNESNQSRKPKYHQDPINTLTKANFLRDSEIILLTICQAILVADNTILNSLNFQGFNSETSGIKFQIEQSYFMDLMKTLVIDFISSITFNSSQNARYFIAEIAGYFETAIDLLIQLE